MLVFGYSRVAPSKGGYFFEKKHMYTLIAPIIAGIVIAIYPAVAGLEAQGHRAAFNNAYQTIPKTIMEKEVWVTAYSSTPEETDDTPFTTASGTDVHKGIIATNFLSFGTQVKIPELFGDRIFVVEDRMHRRKTDFIDIWMPTKEEAKEFGIARAKIMVIN